MIKKTLLVLLGLLLLSIIGGYWYFDRKFTPPQNQLEVLGTAEVDLHWKGTAENPNSFLLLPVQIEGFKRTFYLQLDYGAPNSLLYKVPLEELDQRAEAEERLEFDALNLGSMELSRDGFFLLDYGVSLDQKEYPVIGTLGADILEKRVVTMDFVQERCHFTEEAPSAYWESLSFNKRKLLFEARINERALNLLFDSGSSGYQWITDKKNWEQARVPQAAVREEKGNSWGRTLTVYTSAAQGDITMGQTQVPLREVTYVEGYSRTQELLMRFSGMEGMIGNKFFLGRTLVLDVKNERYSLK